jgi:type I restriction enzyme S subunit
LIATLGDLVHIKGGGTPSKQVPEYWGGKIPWASVKDFKSSELETTADHITELGLQNSAATLVPAGSIVVPTRMALGKVAKTKVDLAINQDLKALFIKDESILDKKYLFRFLESQAKNIERQGKGATVKGVRLEVLKALEVPLPPMVKQKRVAAILDKIDSIRKRRQKGIELSGHFLKSVFLEMFGDPGVNPNKWPKGTIRDLVSEARYGTSGKADAEKGEFSVLRMGNLTYSGSLDLSNLKYMDIEPKDQGKYLVRDGDLLFNRTNSKELVGKTAIYDRTGPMALAGYLIRVRTNDRGNPYYISGYLNSAHGKTTLFSICKSIVGMANINAQEMQDIPILIPPIELQNQFEKITKAVRVSLTKHEESLRELEELFATLSQRAFSGQL